MKALDYKIQGIRGHMENGSSYATMEHSIVIGKLSTNEYVSEKEYREHCKGLGLVSNPSIIKYLQLTLG